MRFSVDKIDTETQESPAPRDLVTLNLHVLDASFVMAGVALAHASLYGDPGGQAKCAIAVRVSAERIGEERATELLEMLLAGVGLVAGFGAKE